MQTTSPTIAIFAAEYCDYQKVLVDNIAAANARKGFGTLCIAGRELNPRLESLQDLSLGNEIYQLLSHSPVKGLISLSGSIGNNGSLDQLTEFLNQFNLPKVSLGIAVPGIPNVLVDDRAAMSQLMKHLINETGSKRFAFIRGFSNDPYSQQREQIFRQELDDAGLCVDENLIVKGNYNSFETYQAINHLLTVQGDAIDAIVAANDFMALSAARAVAAHGLDIPGKIVISGFDDTSEATQHSPALTTIRQPLIDMANLSVDLLLEQIETSQYKVSNLQSQNVTVNSELIIRGSTVRTGSKSVAAGHTNKETLYTLIKHAMSGLDDPPEIDLRSLTDSFWHTLQDGGNHLSEALNPGLVDDIQLEQRHWWSNFSHHIETYARRALSSGNNSHRITAVTAALSPLKERSWALTMEKDFETQRFNGAQSNMQLQVSSCSRLDDILTATAKWLNNIKPRRCYLAHYELPSDLPHGKSELIQAFEDGVVKEVSNSLFDTTKLLPDNRTFQLEKGLLVLSPIFAGDRHFGYLLLDPHGLKAIDIASAARSIGNAMRSQYLLDKLEQHARTLEHANSELVQLANFDSVTDLPNRLHFHQRLEKALTDFDSEKSALSLIFVDLDGFKRVNDTMGHDAGDQLLKIIAKRLKSSVHAMAGDGGFVSRLGGDEFTVIIETHKSESQSLLSRITEKILCTVRQPCEINDQVAMVSASIGYTFCSNNANSVEALMKLADKAMYQSKEYGKNRITFISGKNNLDNFSIDSIIGNDKPTLLKDKIQPKYRARMSLMAGVVSGAEAVSNWIPTSGKDSVVRSMGVNSEKTGEPSAINETRTNGSIDYYFNQLRQWRSEGIEIPLTINVPFKYVKQQTFAAQIIRKVEQHQIQSSDLELKIVQNSGVAALEEISQEIRLLQNKGFRITIEAIDSKHPSLISFANLSVDGLYLRHSLLPGTSRGDDSAIIEKIRRTIAVFSLAGIQVVADGVTTEAEYRMLRSFGIDNAQGSYFHPELTAAELARLPRDSGSSRTAA